MKRTTAQGLHARVVQYRESELFFFLVNSDAEVCTVKGHERREKVVTSKRVSPYRRRRKARKINAVLIHKNGVAASTGSAAVHDREARQGPGSRLGLAAAEFDGRKI